MYIPQHFSVTDEQRIDALLDRYSFATLVSTVAGALMATHIPVVVRREASGRVVYGHLARANPHRNAMDGTSESLVIFQGPHAYVSPTWYANTPAVPTWNYAVVHAYGRARATEDPAAVEQHLRDLVARHESHRQRPWRLEDLPSDYRTQQVSGIVAFAMPVERLEAKFKLGQNRVRADRMGTIAGLEREEHADARAMAAFMRSHLQDVQV
jgi:transcriptional regulator